MQICGADVQVFHAGQHPAQLHLVADVGSASEATLHFVHGLAEANAWLMTDSHGATLCRRPHTPDYVLRTSLTLQAVASGHDLVERVHAHAEAALALRQMQAQNDLCEPATTHLVHANFV